MILRGVLVCVLLLWVEGSWGDTPANCTYEDLLGTWVFQLSKGGQDKTINCSAEGKETQTVSKNYFDMIMCHMSRPLCAESAADDLTITSSLSELNK